MTARFLAIPGPDTIDAYAAACCADRQRTAASTRPEPHVDAPAAAKPLPYRGFQHKHICLPILTPRMETASPPLETTSADELQSLEPSMQTVWSIKRGAFATITAFAVFFYDLAHLFGTSALPFGVLTAIVAVLGVLYALIWPRLMYRNWGFSIRSEEIYIEHGVLNHIRTVVPLRRIQHLDVSQDLLEREFSLGRLIVHTAGSRSSDVVIPGLNLKEAERIRDRVKQFILEDPLMEDPV